jgi:hypothetical protein
MAADSKECLVAVNMPESSTSLANPPQEAEDNSSPSVSLDGMAVTVIIQLQAWNVSLVLMIIMYISY